MDNFKQHSNNKKFVVQVSYEEMKIQNCRNGANFTDRKQLASPADRQQNQV